MSRPAPPEQGKSPLYWFKQFQYYRDVLPVAPTVVSTCHTVADFPIMVADSPELLRARPYLVAPPVERKLCAVVLEITFATEDDPVSEPAQTYFTCPAVGVPSLYFLVPAKVVPVEATVSTVLVTPAVAVNALVTAKVPTTVALELAASVLTTVAVPFTYRFLKFFCVPIVISFMDAGEFHPRLIRLVAFN